MDKNNQQNTDILGQIDQNTEMALLQGQKMIDSVDNLEPIMEGVLVKTDELLNEQKKTNKLLEKEKKEEEEKLQTVADEITVTLKGLKGDTGKEGYTPVKGEDYFTETEIAEFKVEITPIKGVDYRDGIDGYTPIKGVDYFDGIDGKTPIAGVDFPLPKDGEPGADGKPGPRGPKGKDGDVITGETIKEKLEALEKGLDYDSLYNKPNIEDYIQRIKTSSRDYDLTELKDVVITNPTNNQVLKYNITTGKWENGTGGGSGTPTNGLQTIGSNIGLGGTLTQDTTITGGLFSWLLSALDVTLLGSNSAEIAAPTTSVSATSVLRVRTPDVNDASATAGHFLKLIDASTGESEFTAVPISGVNGLQAALDAKANDSDVVHKTGNETISGEKTFTGKVITDTNQAETSAGGSLKAANGTTVATYGQGNSSNFTAEGAVKLNNYTASRIVTTDSNKNVETANSKTTDGTLAGNSDTNIPTEKAVKTYVDSIAPPIFSPTLGNNRALVVDDFVHVTGSGGTFNTAFMAFSGGNVVSVNNTISTLGNKQGVVVCNHNGSGDNLWSMNRTVALGQGVLKIACYFRRPSDSGAANQSNVRIGLRIGTGDGTNGVFFKLNEATNSDLWQCITRASSTSTTTNTSVSTTKGDWVKLYIVINAAGNEVLFYINGTLVATHTTNIPASGTALSGIINVERTVVSSVLAYAIDYFMVDQTFTTAR
ncbi:collagen-like protein [Candidatus Dojkabacteria bacterium]|uniref:Collagen-like protein n=1 Tax=Candidatus Dojkabacteria bacterium TaxID=2099670 RepID=A0A5C7J335_9BACT|nr:MAG: collagen-like protein [Candidatus Dojkabacteria bacterium]